MTTQLDSTAFRELRSTIEADLKRFASARPTIAELQRVKESLRRLQAISDTLVLPTPVRPQMPPKPVIPTPPPIPKLLLSERYRQVSMSTSSEIKRLRATIALGQPSKAMRRQLFELEQRRVRQLHQIIREDSPSGFLEQRENLKRQHKLHQREERKTEQAWTAKCRELQDSWEKEFEKWKIENQAFVVRQHSVDRLMKEWQ